LIKAKDGASSLRLMNGMLFVLSPPLSSFLSPLSMD